MDNIAQATDLTNSQTAMQQTASTQHQDVRNIMQCLNQCPHTINPAIELYWELTQRQNAGTLSLEELLLRQPEIQRCQADGQRQLDAVSAIQIQLKQALPQPCNPLIVLV